MNFPSGTPEWLNAFKTAAAVSNEDYPPAHAFKLALDCLCPAARFEIGHAFEVLASYPLRLRSFKVWHFDNAPRFKRFRFLTEHLRDEPQSSSMGQVVETGKPLWIRNVAEEPKFYRREEAARLGIRTGVLVPAKFKSEVVAVVELFATEIRDADAATLEILEYLGIILGRIVERKRLETAIEKLHSS